MMRFVASGMDRPDVDDLSVVVYVNPPHARPNKPSTIRMIPSVLFMRSSRIVISEQASLRPLLPMSFGQESPIPRWKTDRMRSSYVK